MKAQPKQLTRQRGRTLQSLREDWSKYSLHWCRLQRIRRSRRKRKEMKRRLKGYKLQLQLRLQLQKLKQLQLQRLNQLQLTKELQKEK